MEIYKVGGCVRDQLMGLIPKDIDYVVVGSNPEEMLSMGYEQVGKDFPVFLHPINQCEYALARTERKTGQGYNGFDVLTNNVSLEEDLFRRDLTINAMALDTNNNLIDPYNGQIDLKNKILKHVSEHFKEDPVRILRIARFSARYNFTIAPETLLLMKEMVEKGEFDFLTSERVWKEFEKVLTEPHIKNFFSTLEIINALKKITGFKEIKEMEYFSCVYEKMNENSFNLNLLHIFSQMLPKDLKKWKIPTDQQLLITQYGYWKNNENFYSNMSYTEKVNFIQQNKGLHFLEKPIILLSSIITYHNWKNNTNISMDLEKEKLIKDINTLKNLDYNEIVQESLKNNIKPNIAVNNAQINLLEKQNKLKNKFL